MLHVTFILLFLLSSRKKIAFFVISLKITSGIEMFLVITSSQFWSRFDKEISMHLYNYTTLVIKNMTCKIAELYGIKNVFSIFSTEKL